MCVIRYTGHANVEFKVDSVLSHDDAYVAPPPLVQNKDSNATVNIALTRFSSGNVAHAANKSDVCGSSRP
jgi:hypothetical protein